MAGIRIQHASARNVRFTMSDPKIPYDVPYHCTPPEFGGCGGVHLFKTHHLNIDESGSAIIGDQLYAKVKPLLLAVGFTEANVVERPPVIGIGLLPATPGSGAWGNIPILRAEEI